MPVSFLTMDPDNDTSIREAKSSPSYLDGVQYRDFIIRLETNFFLYEIQSTDGKQLPGTLASKYTAPETAREAIDKYYTSIT